MLKLAAEHAGPCFLLSQKYQAGILYVSLCISKTGIDSGAGYGNLDLHTMKEVYYVLRNSRQGDKSGQYDG